VANSKNIEMAERRLTDEIQPIGRIPSTPMITGVSAWPHQEHWFDFSREPAMFHEDGIMTAWCFHCGRWEDWRLCRRQD
jgi:hypothetical protein